MSQVTEITVERFLEEVLKTNVPQAKEWIERSLNTLPPELKGSVLRSAGENKISRFVQWLVGAIAAQVSKEVRVLHHRKQDYGTLPQVGKLFVKEIVEKAKQLGVDTDKIETFEIYDPQRQTGSEEGKIWQRH